VASKVTGWCWLAWALVRRTAACNVVIWLGCCVHAPEAHRQSIANGGTTLFINAAHEGRNTRDPALGTLIGTRPRTMNCTRGNLIWPGSCGQGTGQARNRLWASIQIPAVVHPRWNSTCGCTLPHTWRRRQSAADCRRSRRLRGRGQCQSSPIRTGCIHLR
jgi:hypothetical protein